MSQRLPATAFASDGLFTRADAIAAGHGDDELQGWVRDGHVRRLQRGIFAVGDVPQYADGRLIERARALARLRGDHIAVSHHAALAIHGIATYDVPLHTLYAVRLVGAAQSTPGVRLLRPRTAPPTVVVNGVRVVTPVVAVVQVAAEFGFHAGCVAVDSGLHHGLVTPLDLRDEVERAGAIPGISRARMLTVTCRSGAESPGETLLRLTVERLGYRTETQCPISVDNARPFAFADLRIVGTRGLLEFDGALKYGGADGRRALINEKAREDRIRGLGWHLERVVWRDFEDLPVLIRRIHALALRAT